MNVSAAKDAINTYFPSEASEMYILIASSVALVILGIVFLTLLHGRFSQIFGVGLLVLALIYGSTGISLLTRDSANQARLNAALDAPCCCLGQVRGGAKGHQCWNIIAVRDDDTVAKTKFFAKYLVGHIVIRMHWLIEHGVVTRHRAFAARCGKRAPRTQIPLPERAL